MTIRVNMGHRLYLDCKIQWHTKLKQEDFIFRCLSRYLFRGIIGQLKYCPAPLHKFILQNETCPSLSYKSVASRYIKISQ